MLLLLLALTFISLKLRYVPTKPPVLKRPGNRPHTLEAFSLTTVAVVGPTGVSVGPNTVAVVQSPVVVTLRVAVGPEVAGHLTAGLAVPAETCPVAVAEGREDIGLESRGSAVVHQLADFAAIAGPYPLENLASHTLGLGN